MMLTTPPIAHRPSPWKLVIVTGRSQSDSCALSEAQLQFLSRLEDYLQRQAYSVPKDAILQRNFPFVEDRNGPSRRVGLLRASWANLRQYLSARTIRYRQQAVSHWQALLDSADQTNLIAGSCGLELLVRTVDSLRVERPLNVLALGPVANRRLVQQVQARKLIKLHTLCGDRDWIASSWSWRHTCPHVARIASLGHLGYWTNHAVESFACKWLFDRISELQAAAVTCRRG